MITSTSLVSYGLIYRDLPKERKFTTMSLSSDLADSTYSLDLAAHLNVAVVTPKLSSVVDVISKVDFWILVLESTEP